VLSRRSTILTYLIKDHNIDKAIGLLKKHSKIALAQLMIEDYPAKRLLI